MLAVQLVGKPFSVMLMKTLFVTLLYVTSSSSFYYILKLNYNQSQLLFSIVRFHLPCLSILCEIRACEADSQYLLV